MSTSVNKKAPRDEARLQNFSRDLAGLICIFAAVFSVLAIVSFSSQDPSWFTASNQSAKNLGGLVGSHWAALLLQVFGAASFTVALSFLFSGVALFRRLNKKELAFALLNYVVLIFISAATLGIFRKNFLWNDHTLALGGIVGMELGGFLRRHLNVAGSILLNSSLLVLALSVTLRMSIKDMALHSWLLVSKVFIWTSSMLLFAAMQILTALAAARDTITPPIRKGLQCIGQALGNGVVKIFEVKVPNPFSSAEAKADEIKLEEAAAPLAPVLNIRPKETNDILAPVITARGGANSLGLNLESNAADVDIELDTGSSIVNFVKKAVRENERVVKEALGKKITYELPPLSFLRAPSGEELRVDQDELIRNSATLREKLADFKIDGVVTAVNPGPVVTMYEFKPGPGIKVNSIAQVADDLALALSAESVRIVAPIPGRDVVGMEVPNRQREKVLLKEIIGSDAFQDRRLAIPIAIGKDILGNPCATDLRKMPHMLVAGATGSGKSVFINALLCSLLYRFKPDDLKLILVDPKQLELNLYEAIPHLLLPVVTDPKKASLALRWAVEEMERRYSLIAKVGMRDADGFNQKLAGIGQAKLMELLQKSGDPVLADAANCEPMPKLIIIIDELADLMMTAKADVETNICRLAQKARAAGIHLVLATQRPSVDVVTGLIKANLPARISFRLSSKNDSRTIFDSMGAERLVGMGDMLFMPPGESRLVRMHGAYVGEAEIEQLTNFWRAQGTPVYREEILVDPEEDDFEGGMDTASSDADPKFQEALDIAYNSGFISASLLQRRMGIGYPKAARYVEIMEAKGIVGPAQGSKPRPVIGARP